MLFALSTLYRRRAVHGRQRLWCARAVLRTNERTSGCVFSVRRGPGVVRARRVENERTND